MRYNITPREQETLDRCCAYLDAEQLDDCYVLAWECISDQVNSERAVEILVPLLAEIMLRNRETGGHHE